MHPRVLPRAASIAIAAVLMLSACSSGEPEAAPKPSPTPSETVASETPEPSESATPKAETAEEFIRRWVVLSHQMQVTGKTEEFRGVSGDCPTCLGFADRIEEIYSNGGWVKDGGWTIDRILRVRKTPNGGRTVDAKVTLGEDRYKEQRDGDTKTLPGGRLVEQFVLGREDGEWRMLDYAELSNGE